MSRISIFPPVATVYPNDRQTFTAQAKPQPALWHSVGNSADIKADSSLEVDGAQSQGSGVGGHALMSGIGILEFTIDDQCNPDSAGRFNINGRIFDVAGFQYFYGLNIDATSIEVRDENLTQIYTESYTTVSGDVYRIEFSAGFRLYRNGVLKHSRTGLSTVVVYPMDYNCTIIEPTTAAPTRIPQPRLIGDWRLSNTPTLVWTVSHGSLTTTTGITTEYFAATVPGQYALGVHMQSADDASAVQQASAAIEVPPLQVLGETFVTLQPGQKFRPKTNYDAAQTKLITWSVVAGPGSFTQDEFTAGTAPGISVIRATASVNGLSADITVFVPAVITNANGYTAAKASEEIDFAVNFQTMPSYVNAGFLASGTAGISPTVPLGYQAGDILLLVGETANEAVSTPSGYGIVADSPQGTGTAGDAAATRLSMFWKRAGVVESPPSVADPGDHVVGQIVAIRGCIATGDPWDVTGGDTGSSSTSVSIPGDTTTVANTLVVLAVSNGTDTATSQTSGFTNADLANLTERIDSNAIAGNGGGFAIATGEKAAAGAYGATTATLATASTQGRMSVALKPGAITWSASIGSINSSTGIWTAPSLPGQIARITATNGTYTITLEVPVLEVFPLTDPTLPLTRARNLTALIGMSEDRSNRLTREKAPAFDSYEVKFRARSTSEVSAVDAFFDSHGFGKLFIFEDKVRNVRKVGWFDSIINHEGNDECDGDFSFRFLEARLG